MTSAGPREYPPAPHVLRDLDFEVEIVGPGRQIARYSPGPSGRVELGGVLTVVDLVAGSVCLRSVAPDWMATSTLMFHLTDEDLVVEELMLTADAARVGRNVVTVEVHARSVASGALIGEGIATFARLPRRESNLPVVGGPDGRGHVDRFSFSGDGRDIGAGGSFADAVGCSVVDASTGATETPVTEYVRNSFGAVNGGVVAGLVEVAAREVVGAPRGSPHICGVTIHYFSQGRIGPVRTSASLLRGGRGAGSTVRVEVVDAGAEGGERLMAVAHVGVLPVAAG